MLQSFDQTTQSISPTPGDSVDSLASVFLRFCPLTKEQAWGDDQEKNGCISSQI
jgi:hypothetical protein